jgi:hypothetical protein
VQDHAQVFRFVEAVLAQKPTWLRNQFADEVCG